LPAQRVPIVSREWHCGSNLPTTRVAFWPTFPGQPHDRAARCPLRDVARRGYGERMPDCPRTR